jgi:hypothetical protein
MSSSSAEEQSARPERLKKTIASSRISTNAALKLTMLLSITVLLLSSQFTRLFRFAHYLSIEEKFLVEPAADMLQAARTALSSATVEAEAEATPSTPFEQLNSFLRQHPDTPGARFINLLRTHVYQSAGSVSARMDACAGSSRKPPFGIALIHCLTGQPSDPTRSTFNQDTNLAARSTFMPLNSTVSIYDMLRYPGMDHFIPALGTVPSCLPLFLAGAAVGATSGSMAIELGPYFGLSSKCIVAGMKTHGVRDNSYLAFDTFEGGVNFRSVQKKGQHRWILDSYPFYTAQNSSFLFLWEKAVRPIYPTARGRPGWISESTLNLQTIGLGGGSQTARGDEENRPKSRTTATGVELISVDSAKTVPQLQSQLAGLGRLTVGTILFLLDFEFVKSQVKLVYGCMRHSGYLLPVYTAWANHENWAFVVTKEFSFSEFEFDFPRCIEENINRASAGVNQTYWVEQDIRLMTSLRADNNEEAVAKTQKYVDKLYNKFSNILGFAKEATKQQEVVTF